MGFFKDIGNSFKIKKFMKNEFKDMNKDNVIQKYKVVIDKAKSMDFTAGTLDNVLEEILEEFEKFIKYNDDIPRNKEENLLGEIYRV